MKIAILSDIHGNIYALREVVKQMKEQKIEVVFLLGDQIGYYNYASDVFLEIQKWKHHIIAGNHERIFLKYLRADPETKKTLTDKYGNCFKVYEKEFGKKIIDEIAELPEEKAVEIDGFKFLLSHGSAKDKDQYIYPDTKREVLDEFDTEEYDVLLMGHTHYPMVYNTGNTMLINVGSVGQARNIGGIANWGIFNTSNGVFTQQSTPYDIRPLEQSLINNEKEYLYKILRRNNSTLE